MSKNNFIIIFFILAFNANIAYANSLITFTCSWNEGKPISIIVNKNKNYASRGDKENFYKVIKITKLGVWLVVNEPMTNNGISVHMIQRSYTTNGKAGKWIDIISNYKGEVIPIEGGVCREK